jgi:hypothetical protein
LGAILMMARQAVILLCDEQKCHPDAATGYLFSPAVQAPMPDCMPSQLYRDRQTQHCTAGGNPFLPSLMLCLHSTSYTDRAIAISENVWYPNT